MTDAPKEILRVGIVGAGEVAQVIHLPVLSLLTHLYSVTIVCDLSKKNADHCATKFHIPHSTTKPQDVFDSPDVDVVFILTSDEFHAEYAIAALAANKHVMIEKPITLSVAAGQRIVDAETKSQGKVFVGYMRRYAASFTDVFLKEIESIPRILYARSRDFSGPNAFFVNSSGTFQVKNTDDYPPNSSSQRDQNLHALMTENFGSKPTETQISYSRFLGSLGSHDLSLLREALGPVSTVDAVQLASPFYTASFTCHNRTSTGHDGPSFPVMWESGIDSVPEFDAHLAVYGQHKRVSIQYDSPYVKGLPIRVRVAEVNAEGQFQTREVLGGYEDAYTRELVEMWGCFVEGRAIKTTAKDAMGELRLFEKMYGKYKETMASR